MADHVIALLTDFGTEDTYVGVMKGVMQRIHPAAKFIDLTHAIAPQRVREAAFSLVNAYMYFEPGTVFLIVVDPGVGSLRRSVAVSAKDYTFVAPDNGVLSYVLATCDTYQAIELDNPAYRLAQVSQTFHGRDVFAPAAAYLASGTPLRELGSPVDDLVKLPQPEVEIQNRRVVGEVIQIDRFGNVITSLGHVSWRSETRLSLTPAFGQKRVQLPFEAQAVRMRLNDTVITSVNRTYSDAPRGGLLALVGSSGYLEVSVNQGDAADRLDATVGDRVELELGEFDATVRD